MTAPKRNAELAYKVLDQIDAHPESWSQATWDCGTMACFAGWAVKLSGGTSDGSAVIAGPEELVGMHVEFAAYKALGIDEEDAYRLHLDETEWLFGPDRNREDLGRLVAEIFGPRPEPIALGEEMQPPPCGDHESSELSCPVCTAQRRAFYAALGRDAS